MIFPEEEKEEKKQLNFKHTSLSVFIYLTKYFFITYTTGINLLTNIYQFILSFIYLFILFLIHLSYFSLAEKVAR